MTSVAHLIGRPVYNIIFFFFWHKIFGVCAYFRRIVILVQDPVKTVGYCASSRSLQQLYCTLYYYYYYYSLQSGSYIDVWLQDLIIFFFPGAASPFGPMHLPFVSRHPRPVNRKINSINREKKKKSNKTKKKRPHAVWHRFKTLQSLILQ